MGRNQHAGKPFIRTSCPLTGFTGLFTLRSSEDPGIKQEATITDRQGFGPLLRSEYWVSGSRMVNERRGRDRDRLAMGCVLLRHGSRHDIYSNPAAGLKQRVPRILKSTTDLSSIKAVSRTKIISCQLTHTPWLMGLNFSTGLCGFLFQPVNTGGISGTIFAVLLFGPHGKSRGHTTGISSLISRSEAGKECTLGNYYRTIHFHPFLSFFAVPRDASTK